MPYDGNDPAFSGVFHRLQQGKDVKEAYYDVFVPRRKDTLQHRKDYYKGIIPAVLELDGQCSRIEVQGQTFRRFPNVSAAFVEWMGNGMDFLHIHRSEDSRFRVYIPADLRHVADIVRVLWRTRSLTGFKIAGYDDAHNRTDVIVAWVKEISGVHFIGHSVPPSWLRGMRPPGSTMIKRGCLIGYSEEVPGTSMGTEITEDLERLVSQQSADS